MNMIENYFKVWLFQIGEFRKYRNTLICVLVVCLLTLFHRHHRLDMLLSLGQYQQYFLPLTFLFYGLTLLVIPLLTAPLLLPADRFGFRIGNIRTWWVDVAVAWLVVFVLILIFCRTPAFLRTYPLYQPIGSRWTWKLFLFYQVCQFIYMFGWEFIFRGYLLFSTKKELGIIPALILQMIPFAFLHLGKPEMEVYGSVLAGLFLGLIALRANSFLPCVFLHFTVALSMDLFAIFYKGSLRLF
jgi:membrane protease YdiL (CAAX protease family)